MASPKSTTSPPSTNRFRDYGPARIGDQAYPANFEPLSALTPTTLAAESVAPLSSDDAARLRQRRLLLELGEADRRIPWHDRALDKRARRAAFRALVRWAATAQGSTSSARAALQTLSDVHGDPRLDDDTTAEDLELLYRLTKRLGLLDLMADSADRRQGILAAPWERWLERIKERPAPQRQTPELPVFSSDLEEGVERELRWEAAERQWLSTWAPPKRPDALIGGTLIWTGTRARIGLSDPLKTFLPDWIAVSEQDGRRFPESRSEAIAAAAWRLSHRGPVALVAASSRSHGKLTEALRWLREQAESPEQSSRPLAVLGRRSASLGAVAPRHDVTLLKAGAALDTTPSVSAVVLYSAEVDGAMIDPSWLTQLCASMATTPTPVLLCGVNGNGPRRRVVRAVRAAEHVLNSGSYWRSPLVRLLDIVCDELGQAGLMATIEAVRQVADRGEPAASDAVGERHAGNFPRLDPWISGILIKIPRACERGAPLELAWRTSDDQTLRDAVEALRGQ